MKKIAYSKAAFKYLRSSPRQKQIVKRIEAVAAGEQADVKPMQGNPGYYRLRVGDFRVIWKLSDDGSTMEIMAVGPRGDIYK